MNRLRRKVLTKEHRKKFSYEQHEQTRTFLNKEQRDPEVTQRERHKGYEKDCKQRTARTNANRRKIILMQEAV